MDMAVPTDTRTEPFAEGDLVAMRSVNTYGAHGEAVGFAVAGRVLVDDEDLAVVATPAGSAVRRRAGAGSGPNGRLVVPDDWDGSYVEDGWFGAPVVRVHRKGTPWSVWRWHDGVDWEPDWYVNLELPWARTATGFDSQDWTLDVVARVDEDGTWSVRYKDEDELAFYAGLGLWPAAMRSVIEGVGARAVASATARAFPFDADWSAWVPDPMWAPVDLPTGWDRLDRHDG
ncbi:DUF402 domain-containing protein [Curtobacterium sp. MCLR17_007]|uniref:DUF402 domain-containing protein n=1 Tax=Curtobacterium sp. MCLR17_007 TaxID=2175648 RepID=UPI000DA93002|nr:DUF402 domain-containing protein [Curtobacterium sp. MCLR17_007]WIB59375.1 DUF402 domain-containing protein [Curtobacterium sp. MCLR17_007]